MLGFVLFKDFTTGKWDTPWKPATGSKGRHSGLGSFGDTPLPFSASSVGSGILGVGIKRYLSIESPRWRLSCFQSFKRSYSSEHAKSGRWSVLSLSNLCLGAFHSTCPQGINDHPLSEIREPFWKQHNSPGNQEGFREIHKAGLAQRAACCIWFS